MYSRSRKDKSSANFKTAIGKHSKIYFEVVKMSIKFPLYHWFITPSNDAYIMPQNANDWANISALVQIEAMYQGMHTVYEQSIQVVNFKMDYHFS